MGFPLNEIQWHTFWAHFADCECYEKRYDSRVVPLVINKDANWSGSHDFRNVASSSNFTRMYGLDINLKVQPIEERIFGFFLFSYLTRLTAHLHSALFFNLIWFLFNLIQLDWNDFFTLPMTPTNEWLSSNCHPKVTRFKMILSRTKYHRKLWAALLFSARWNCRWKYLCQTLLLRSLCT